MVDEKIIKETLTLLKVTYPNSFKDLTKEDALLMIKVWLNDFKNEEEEIFKKAIGRLRYKCKYIPSVSEIKEEIAIIKNESLQLDVDDEWSKVIRLFGKYGADREEEALKELCPYTANVVKMMGWRYLCQSPTSQRQWNEKEFKNLMSNKNINLKNYEIVGYNATERELTYKEQILQDELEYDRMLELDYMEE